jgi:hypothetical protein
LNDRLYGRAQSRTNFPSRRTRPRTFRRNGAASYPALFQQKAIALLVIDATGEEPVSEMLNERRIVQGTTTPLMHAWILGNGEAVQVLWADRLNYACYRCLRVINRDGMSEARFPVLKHESERKQIGCHAFTRHRGMDQNLWHA